MSGSTAFSNGRSRGSDSPLDVFQWGLGLGIGLIFVIAAIAKFRNPQQFLDAVYAYEIVGPEAGVVVAMVVPAFELAIGLCLVWGIAKVGAYVLAAGLLWVFVLAQASALSRGLDVSCGCIGWFGQDPVSGATIGRTLLLLGAATTGLIVTLRMCWQPEPTGRDAPAVRG